MWTGIVSSPPSRAHAQSSRPRVRTFTVHWHTFKYLVCVLDSQDALPTAGLREEEVEQCGPGTAQVQVSGGAGREPQANHRGKAEWVQLERTGVGGARHATSFTMLHFIVE